MWDKTKNFLLRVDKWVQFPVGSALEIEQNFLVGRRNLQTINEQVLPINKAFYFQIDEKLFANLAGTKTYSATLANGNALPSWLTFDAVTRTFYGIPPNAETLSVKLRVSNGQINLESTFSMRINAMPQVFSVIADQTLNVELGGSKTITIAKKSFSGTNLSYRAELADGNALPIWLSFDGVSDANNLYFTVVSHQNNVVPANIKIIATDDAGQKVSTSFSLTMRNVGFMLTTVKSDIKIYDNDSNNYNSELPRILGLLNGNMLITWSKYINFMYDPSKGYEKFTDYWYIALYA